MGEQRRGRGGRGRSGRGGRIPRRGEQGGAIALGEEFSPFPADLEEPIRVEPALDPAAVGACLRETVAREAAVLAALEPLLESTPSLARVKTEVERHRDTLEQLGADLGAEAAEAPPGAGAELTAAHRLAVLGWETLQRAAYAFGDRRIDRVTRPVLREKARQTEVIEGAALAAATGSLARAME